MSVIDTTPGVYTSTTRPAVPFIGQTIFEKDTGKIMVYYGATTGWMPRWFHEWGEVAAIRKVTNFSPVGVGTVEDVPGTEIIFQPGLGRYLMHSVSGAMLANDNCTGTFWLQNSTGGAYANIGTAVAGPAPALAAVYRSFTITSFFQTGSTPLTLKLKCAMMKTGAGGPAILLIGATEPLVVKCVDIGARFPPIIG